MSGPEWFEVQWDAPTGVRAVMTTRCGGVSRNAFASLNLGDHVGDAPAAVRDNRERLGRALGVDRIAWMRQVHGSRVLRVGDAAGEYDGVSAGEERPMADAAVTRADRFALAVMVADCLPVLLSTHDGASVAAAHAGWRGLAGGVIGAAVSALSGSPESLCAWLGPCISAANYEVDEAVRAHFYEGSLSAFESSRTGHYHMDLREAAIDQLRSAGVRRIRVDRSCVFSDASRFYSHRRSSPTGRTAALIWRTGSQ